MNPTEISEALAALVAKPYDAIEFPFEFAEATDNNPATVARLRNGAINKSDLAGGVLMNQKFHFVPAMPGLVSSAFDKLRASSRNARHKPAILIATDGTELAAEHPRSGDILYGPLSDLRDRFGFFLPAAGKERYSAAEENPVDVKVSGKLAKLYDALIRKNPGWAAEDRHHEMNQLMTRLIFCMFAEDVGVFPENQFSRLLFTHSGDKGEGMREALVLAFTAMNIPRDCRDSLPAWTHELEYVNGSLFAGNVEAPEFDAPAARYLRDVCTEDWKGINPDIFGSMIQSVANVELRSELGMHYTSVPNIMKVIGPLFLDELDAEIENALDRERVLRQILVRISKIRVFDPACGSGNFLVVTYRALRDREIRVLSRIAELSGNAQVEMWSAVPISNFYGIELTDLGAETAKLALFIAEYQANALFKEAFGRKPADLPLREAANVVCGNALRLEWETVCPVPDDGGEVFIVGNPPFLGKAQQDADQKADKDFVFSGVTTKYKSFDYVAGWFYKAGLYIERRNACFALVSTNSIVQGDAVSTIWPLVLRTGREIFFAHRTFKWRNNASANAAVMCVIVGVRNRSSARKTIIDEKLTFNASNINCYLLDVPDLAITRQSVSLFDLPTMRFGNMPGDGGHLILSAEEARELRQQSPEASRFLFKFLGSQEVIRGIERWCLWLPEEDRHTWERIEEISRRLRLVTAFRANSTRDETRQLAGVPHRFIFEAGKQQNRAILVPSVTSERRPYLPFERVGADTIASNLNFALYDAPDWCIALIGSRLHLVWIGTVCGKLKSDFRYSNTLGWNTFPVPKFTADQEAALKKSAMGILRCRLEYHPKTIADLYDPEKMPDDLRTAHKANDDLLESMYVGRPFRNDTERLEHLFKLYAARTKKLKKEAT